MTNTHPHELNTLNEHTLSFAFLLAAASASFFSAASLASLSILQNKSRDVG
jgi:hypothetical protein